MKYYRICTQCNYFSREEEKENYCPTCGNELINKCQKCGKKINNPYDEYCKKCGNKYRKEKTINKSYNF